MRPSELPFEIEGQHLILIDDVLMSGRTVRAAMNELFDYGRPASVTLVSLLDLNARELPIRPDVVGATLSLAADERVKLLGPAPLALERQVLTPLPETPDPQGLPHADRRQAPAAAQRPGPAAPLPLARRPARELLTEILDTADSFLEVGARAVKKVPLLRGKTVCNVFFENSTRTRTTFELAAQRLSADVITLNVSTSSTSKGETLFDTLRNLEAMAADMFVVRHADSGAAHFIAEHVCPDVAIINGGDGRHAHPTQGMLDMLTIRRHKGGFENLSVAIVGDILHSRVARSNMLALKALGCPDIRVVAPKTLLPIGIEQYGVSVYTDLAEGLKDVDVVIMLRLQRERMQGGLLPSEGEFYRLYGLSTQRLALAAGRHRHAPRPDQPWRGDRIGGGRRRPLGDPQPGHLRHRHPHGRAVHGHERPEHPTPDQPGSRGAELMRTHIIGARLIDPASGTDQVTDLYLEAGKVAGIGQAPAGYEAERSIDAKGLVAAPGLVDLNAALREPGYSRKGNIDSETRAAAAGGVTSLCCPPLTRPVLDTPPWPS